MKSKSVQNCQSKANDKAFQDGINSHLNSQFWLIALIIILCGIFLHQYQFIFKSDNYIQKTVRKILDILVYAMNWHK